MSTESQVSDLKDALERTSLRLRFLADVSSALAGNQDAEEALRSLARLVVSYLAEACVVDVLDGDLVRRVAVAHRDPERAWRVPVGEFLPVADSTAPLARVLRGAGPLRLTDFTPSPMPGPLGIAQQELYRTLEAGSALIVPMSARRQVLGAIILVRPASTAGFDEEDTALAVDLGHRAALALDNARLYAFQQRTAEQLQRSLLPELTGVESVPLEARYVAARERAEVGGDWYDAFSLTDGSTVLAIGDVVGHDLVAAVRMGQMRNMLRALAYDSKGSPANVMRRLDRVMQGVSTVELVTAVIARVETPSTGPWRLHWTNAGHPPPLLIGDGGTSQFLEGALAPVLGVDPALRRRTARVSLFAGSTLLLYTDGLIERPGEDIGRGLTRLRQHAAVLAAEPLPVFCDELLGRLAIGYGDDVAVLALRVPTP
ncbi:GAF domain-containing SpoIIE family protein phosphatase [Streptomyces sp. AK02-01A]|uniref:PP2C family protein-serine/threonine phosphatase n=1 Tax=Streptomyces sp. AK02-01A TaxID=3028648 RepID=UPI0029B6BF64|nr:GAF domain-containing SpoIIE family protein phosphatase [Streptomyces sp. AK02-01A]MDX3853718.1 SpoIIE family protein phosphatase [Streptomyces sp. AK02-01A]